MKIVRTGNLFFGGGEGKQAREEMPRSPKRTSKSRRSKGRRSQISNKGSNYTNRQRGFRGEDDASEGGGDTELDPKIHYSLSYDRATPLGKNAYVDTDKEYYLIVTKDGNPYNNNL